VPVTDGLRAPSATPGQIRPDPASAPRARPVDSSSATHEASSDEWSQPGHSWSPCTAGPAGGLEPEGVAAYGGLAAFRPIGASPRVTARYVLLDVPIGGPSAPLGPAGLLAVVREGDVRDSLQRKVTQVVALLPSPIRSNQEPRFGAFSMHPQVPVAALQCFAENTVWGIAL